MTTVADLKLRVSTQGTVQSGTDLRGVGKSAEEMADQVTDAADRTGKAFDAMRSKARINDALEKLDLRPFQRIEREIDQVNAAYNRLAKSGTLSADQMTVATKAHQAALARLNAELAGNAIPGYFDKLPRAAGASAAQVANAMRMIPAQMTDVVTQLQGGASPITVLMQQGGQLKDQFGGVGPMLKGVGSYVLGLAGPVTMLAAGVATLGVAYYQGTREQHAFEAALISTGGRVGLTSDQLGTMAKRLDGVAGVTRGQAAEALAMMAAQSGIAAGNIEGITAVALRLQNAGGPAVSETAARFSELAKDPLGASVKLNEATGFLTESVYSQIRALAARGQADQAAKVAMDAYAATMAERSAQMEANMGSLERGWKSLKDVAREAWDAMLNVGREDTLDQQIAKAAKAVAEAQAVVSRGGIKGWFGETLSTGEEGLQAAQSDLYGLQQRKAAEEAAAKAKADAAKRVQDQVAEDGALGDKRRSIAAAQLAADLAQRKAATDAVLRTEDDKAAALAATRAAGLVSEQEAARQSLAIEQAKLTAKLRLIDQEIKAERDRPLKADDVQGQLAKQAKITDLKSQRAGIVDQQRMAPISTQWKIEAADLSEARASMQQWAQMWTQADDRVRALTEQTAQAQAGMIEAPIAAAAAQADLAITKLQDDAARAKVVYENLIATLRAKGDTGAADALAGKVQGIDQAAAAQAAAVQQKVVVDYLKGSTDGLAAGWDNVSRGIGGAVKAMLDLATEQANYAAALKMAGNDQAKIAQVERRHLQGQIAGYGAMAGAAKGFFKEKTAAYKVLDGMEKASQALQLGLAIKTAAEKMGLLGAETAATVASESLKVGAVAGGQAGQTAAVTAGEAARNAAKIPGVFLAFMSSLGPWGMAAAAAAVAAVWQGSGTHGSSVDMTEQRQAANGTGTVLGDSSAKSESIANAIERLGDVDTMTMRYSAQMLDSLRNIENSMAGVAVQILRAGGITTGANMGLTTGLLGRNQGDPILGMAGLDDYTWAAPGILGDIVGRLQGLWGKTTADIIDSGLALRGTVADLMRGAGVSQYADLRVTESSWFGARKDTSTQTHTQDVSDEMTRQFGLVFSGVGASLRTAAEAMGRDTERIGQQLAAHVFDIPRLSLEGLQGDALQEAIATAVGAQADTLARTVITGLDDFQLIGEGYYETVVRVASGSETAQQALRGLGVAVAGLSDVANKQAEDVAAEITRASLIGAETTRSTTTSRQVTDTTRQLLTPERWETIFEEWINPEGGSNSYSTSQRRIDATYQDVTTTRTVTDTQRVLTGIGEIINTMSGSASEIADAYRALTDVRESLRLLGMSGDAVTRGLLQGAGSLDALTEGMSAFEAGFTTSQEQAAAASARLKADIERLGLAMPASAQGFAALVRGIDTGTDAGQQLLGSVLTLSDQAAQVYGSISDIADERAGLEQQLLELQGDTAAIRAAELAKLDESNRALQTRIWTLQDEAKAAEALVSSGQSVAAFIAELRGGTSTAASLSLRRATYASDLAAAQAGDTDATTRVVASARSLVDAIKTSATDPIQLARDTSRIAAQLAALPATIAYQADQAGQAVSVPAPVATPAPTVPVPAVPAATTATTQSTDAAALRDELAAMRRELEAMRAEMRTRGDAVVTATAKTARILDNVTANGNAVSVVAGS